MSRWIVLSMLLMTTLFAGPCGGPSTSFVLPGWWADIDYLLVWRRERFYPALATTSSPGTGAGTAGVLGVSTTSILFGQDNVGNSPVSGVQCDLGIWMTRCLGFGVGAFSSGQESKGITLTGDGSGAPILARPFYNVVTQVQAAQLISFPGVQTYGDLSIGTYNSLWEFDLYARLRRVAKRWITCDLLGGYFTAQLADSCDITTWSIPAGSAGRLHRDDHFACHNTYNAGLVGFDVAWTVLRGLQLDITGKAGLGNMVQSTTITGHTTTAAGANFSGGLLALPTNIGTYSQSVFNICTMLDAQVRCALWGHLNLAIGYNFFYLPKVQLAGKAIDTSLNISQQEGGALTGATAPVFTANSQSFWTQALSVGGYLAY